MLQRAQRRKYRFMVYATSAWAICLIETKKGWIFINAILKGVDSCVTTS